jgi:hypothetical protein
MVGWKIELFENLGKEHKQVDDRRNNDDQSQFIEYTPINFICRKIVDDRQDKCYQRRAGGKG